MKKKLLTLAVSGLALFAANVASANYMLDGFYGAASGSMSWARDTKVDANASGNNNVEVSHDLGWGGNASIGYIIDQWRLEVEGVYRRWSNDDYKTPGSTINDTGYMRNWAIMGNVFIDIPLTDFVCECPLSMYVGAGAGVSFVRLKVDNSTVKASESDTVFAWQLMGGFAYDLNDCWAITLGYRFFATAKPSFKVRNNEGAVKVADMPYSNNIDLGLRFKF